MFPTTTRAPFALAALLLGATLAGCTLLSGWSDLQGGGRPSTGDASVDAAKPVDDAGDASSAPADSATNDSAVPADAHPSSCVVTCAPVACCFHIDTKQTSCSASCGTGTTATLGCVNGADCKAGEVCCLDIAGATSSSSCKATCSTTDLTLCDPSDSSSCSSPLHCTAGSFAPYQCQ